MIEAPATDAPATDTPDFGAPPETLAFVDPLAEEDPAVIDQLKNSKLIAKTSK